MNQWIGKFLKKENPLHDTLAQVPLFRDLGRKDRQAVGEGLQHLQFAEGDVIFRQGQPGVGLYIVLSGEVEILRDDQDGTRTRVSHVEAGGSFGELALLDESELTASAIATEPTEVGVFHRSDLLSIAERDPAMGVRVVMQLSQMVADRLRRTNRALREAREELGATEAAAAGKADLEGAEEEVGE